jgi:hypothetical protein
LKCTLFRNLPTAKELAMKVLYPRTYVHSKSREQLPRNYTHLPFASSAHVQRILEPYTHCICSKFRVKASQMSFYWHPNEKVLSVTLSKIAYIVPPTLVVRWVLSSVKSFASPKSAILGWRFSSRSMLPGLISLCIMRTRECSCKYARPRAVPVIIWKRASQFRKIPPSPVYFPQSGPLE